MTKVKILPYWSNIINYYYGIRPKTTSIRFIGISIWVWLEKDYGAIRVHTRESIRHDTIDHTVLQFNDESDATAFVLRWI